MMQIEKATLPDLDSIHSLLLKQFDEHAIKVPPDLLKQAVLAMLENKGRGILLVARKESKIVGIAAVSFVWTLEHGGQSAWLDELYILPEYRGQGIGRSLMRQVIGQAQEMGCLAIDLEVDADHRSAERLYEQERFRRLPRSRWVRYLV